MVYGCTLLQVAVASVSALGGTEIAVPSGASVGFPEELGGAAAVQVSG